MRLGYIVDFCRAITADKNRHRECYFAVYKCFHLFMLLSRLPYFLIYYFTLVLCARQRNRLIVTRLAQERGGDPVEDGE